MKRATVVIGAAFGDEGKGLMTDYFARQAGDPPIVVRFNGGAQAGHTVVTPAGDRHVFHHFGAGTLAGARTFLSRTFLINPVLWRMEYEQLFGLDAPPYPISQSPFLGERDRLRTRIFVDHEAPVTTVYDMLANQLIETDLGPNRHGSCGAGINATMQRQKHPELRLFARDLQDRTRLRQIVERIRERNKRWTNGYGTDEMFEQFLSDCDKMSMHINLTDSRMLTDWNDIIFEGAQGLLLDQDNTRFFPHVTHSKTGLANVLRIAEELKIQQLDACYVTRSYVTRHGAGELPGESRRLEYEDRTNVTNPWQGELRFAPMSPENEDIISRAIIDDLYQAKGDVNVTARYAMTHVDQHMPDRSPPWPLHYTAAGPTFKDVKDLQRR